MDQVDTNNGQLIFSTENAGTLTTALTINQTQAATFAGNIFARRGSFGTASNFSFDLYNNGTSYFNGAVTVDDTFTQSGGGASTFSGNVAVGGGTHPSYHANVTSALTLDDEASVFTRGDELYIGNNFYYGASDAGLAIETGKATVIRLARDEFNLYFAASASAGASSSLSEKFKVV